MSFSFIHTADWQIGKPFRNFPERVAGRLEGARLDAIDRLAAAARARGIAHVLVAGDIWDAERLPAVTERQPLVRMAKHAAITWVLIPGNHDAARPASVWSRLAALGLPPNVRALVEPVAAEIAPGVAVLPAPLRSKSAGTDPTLWMDAAETPPGALRIGLAHGSVQGFGSGDDGEGEALIDAARAKRASLDYLALGDWHGTTRIGPRVWYAGTPEPDRFKDNAPGEALAVTLHAGRDPVVERIPAGHYVWVAARHEIHAPTDLARFEAALRARGVALDRMLVRLTLTGRLAAHDIAAVETWRSGLEAEFEHFECETRGLGIAAGASEDLFGTTGEIAAAARALMRIASDTADPRAEDATEALKRFAVLVASESGGGR